MTASRPRRDLRRWGPVLLVCLVLLSACGGAGRLGPAGRPGDPVTTASPSAPSAGPDKLLVIVEENRSIDDVNQNMPFLAGVSARYGHAAHYFAVTHPSLPNYLAVAGGSTFGIRDDHGPRSHPISGTSVFGQLLAHGESVRTYAEAMVGTCLTENRGRYVVRHNPWTYFTDPQERAACQRFDVPAGTPVEGLLADDVRGGDLPTFGLLIPDICDDGHDCSAATTDRWLRRWIPVLQAGPDYRSGHLTIVVTWDEDDHTSGDQIACVVIDPKLDGRTIDTRLDHLGLSAAVSGLADQPPLRDARSAPDLRQVFGLS